MESGSSGWDHIQQDLLTSHHREKPIMKEKNNITSFIRKFKYRPKGIIVIAPVVL
jgi:hypothetical protein